MIERLQRMIARGSGDFHSGSLTVYKSRNLVEELTTLTEPQGANTVRRSHSSSEYSYFFPENMPPGKEAKGQELETT